MSRIAIINRFSALPDDTYPFGDAFISLGHDVQKCDLAQMMVDATGQLCCDSEPVVADAILWRVVDRYWQSGMHLMRAVNKQTMAINASETVRLCADKQLTTTTLHARRIPTAPGVLLPAGALLEAQSQPRVVKPLDVGGGDDIMLIPAGEPYTAPEDAPRLIQPFFGGDEQFMRVLVVGGSVLGAMQRRGQPGMLANNLQQGGEPVVSTVTEEIMDVSLRATITFGAVITGVDLVHWQGQWRVLEINSTPGYRGFVQLHGEQFHERVATALSAVIAAYHAR